ncbi:MAG: aminoacyl-tRNA hydrolase, partial [Candidatus Pacebacteria bacterium]|nr:aminoacyl-tRNA hydrolase [Candidatus Paceibacterota bacterium]
MKIIIGLGNPGNEYRITRHNVGFFVLDKTKDAWNFPDFNFE